MRPAHDPVCRARRHHRLSSIRRDLARDLDRYLGLAAAQGYPASRRRTRLGVLLRPHLLALLVYRVSHYLHASGWGRAARLLCALNLLIHKLQITPQSCIDGGFFLPHPMGTCFHGRAGRDLTIYSYGCCTSEAPALAAPVEAGPRLGDRVSIGVHAGVVGPVVVGDGVTVAFNVMLTSDAPADCLVTARSMRVQIAPSGAGCPTS